MSVGIKLKTKAEKRAERAKKERRCERKGAGRVINIISDIETNTYGYNISGGVRYTYTKDGVITEQSTEEPCNRTYCKAYACGSVVMGDAPEPVIFNGMGDCLERMLRFWYETGETRARNNIFFHNMNFDCAVLAELLLADGVTSKVRVNRSRLYSWGIVLRDENGERPKKFTIYDSANRLNGSLSKLENEVGYVRSYLKQDFDYTIQRDKLSVEEEQYLRDDLLGLSAVMKVLMPDVMDIVRVFKITSASFALAELTVRFNCLLKQRGERGDLLKDYLPTLKNPLIYSLIKQNNTGGLIITRTAEKYYTEYGVRVPVVCCIDINSLYPSIVAKDKLPCGKPRLVEVSSMEEVDKLLKPTNYVCVVGKAFGLLPNNITPILSDIHSIEPFRPNYNTRIRNIDPDDFEHDYLVQESEYKYLTQNGIKWDVSYAIEYDVMPKELADVMGGMYEERRKYKNNPSKSAQSFFLKIYMNSPIGKTAQRCVDRDFDVELREERLTTIGGDIKEEIEYKSHMEFFAAVTAYGRVQLAGAANHIRNVLGYDVIYGDTDSLTVACSIEDLERGLEIHEDRLGVFSTVYRKGVDMCVVSAKCYSVRVVENEKGEAVNELKCVMAGYSKEVPVDLNRGKQKVVFQKMERCKGGAAMISKCLDTPDFIINKHGVEREAIVPLEEDV